MARYHPVASVRCSSRMLVRFLDSRLRTLCPLVWLGFLLPKQTTKPRPARSANPAKPGGRRHVPGSHTMSHGPIWYTPGYKSYPPCYETRGASMGPPRGPGAQVRFAKVSAQSRFKFYKQDRRFRRRGNATSSMIQVAFLADAKRKRREHREKGGKGFFPSLRLRRKQASRQHGSVQPQLAS